VIPRARLLEIFDSEHPLAEYLRQQVELKHAALIKVGRGVIHVTSA
jgi:hypothetical protein